MTALLITLTLIEVAVVLGVVVGFMIAIARSLRRTAVTLGKVAFGVRAIETQTAAVGPGVTAVNERLEAVASAFSDLTGLAEQAAEPKPGRS
jgi:hypothetical protein